MLSSCSFHLFAKRPIVPITTLGEYKDALAIRIALAALQVRLNVLSRSEPLFAYVEFNMLDSAREVSQTSDTIAPPTSFNRHVSPHRPAAHSPSHRQLQACAVCSLVMMCDPSRWSMALQTALRELRALSTFGVTEDEMGRYVQALLADSEQLAAQGDTVANNDQLSYMMESIACGHTFMSAEQAHSMTLTALDALTLEDVNVAARQLGAHVSDWGGTSGESPRPSAFIACVPKDVGLAEDKVSFFGTGGGGPN